MTKEELDAALAKVTRPAPLIVVGPGHPIANFEGFNEPYEGFYRGARVERHPGLGMDCVIKETL